MTGYVVVWRDALGELFVLAEQGGVLHAPGRGGARAGTLFTTLADAHAAVARALEHWGDRRSQYVVRLVRTAGTRRGATHSRAPETAEPAPG